MLLPRVIPCLDVADGRVVKGVQFQGLRDAGHPVELAQSYAEQGADEIVILDVGAPPEERDNQVETVRGVREVLPLPVTVGGGVRQVRDAESLLEAGADKVAVNTQAVEDPSLLSRLAARFGSQCTVLAIDAAAHGNRWSIVVRSGRDRLDVDAIDWARRAMGLGVGEILLTSWDRDGTRSGYDLELIAAIRQAVTVPIIASGGAARAEHMVAAIQAGADAVLAASIFHEGQYTVRSLKEDLEKLGLEVRR